MRIALPMFMTWSGYNPTDRSTELVKFEKQRTWEGAFLQSGALTCDMPLPIHRRKVVPSYETCPCLYTEEKWCPHMRHAPACTQKKGTSLFLTKDTEQNLSNESN